MRNIAVIIAILTLNMVQGQILEPIKWETSVKRITDSEFDLLARAVIEPGWHLYSQTVPEGGPIATSFSFVGSADFLKKGNTKEPNAIVVHDDVFDMEIKYFTDKVTFRQRVKAKTKKEFIVRGVVKFMACNDISCLAPTEEDILFTINN